MKHKEVIIPKEAIYPDFDNDYDFKISFYKNKTDVKNEDLTHIELPNWLGKLIIQKVQFEKEKAVDEFKKQVNKMFN
jgi:hypothetical protein